MVQRGALESGQRDCTRSGRMKPKKSQLDFPFATIKGLLRIMRGHKIILDCDLAEIYGLSTTALNQAVRRNSERFPDEFVFQLTKAEAGSLGSRIVILKELHRGSRRGQHLKYLPLAFAELGFEASGTRVLAIDYSACVIAAMLRKKGAIIV